jgi:hypothetical protein
MRNPMSDPSLHLLEREVEAARAKLKVDLSTLTAPSTYSEFTSDLRSEAVEMKDVLVDKAKASVQSTFDSFIDDIKARAAANPAAALAIGAGIAWRLIQRPPIATALIGAGLYSLFRSTPSPSAPRDNESLLTQARERLGEQASDFAGSVKERALAVGEAAAEKASDLAADVKARAVSLGEAATEKAGDVAGTAKQWGSQANAKLHRAVDDTGGIAGHAADRLQSIQHAASDTVSDAASRVGAVAQQWTRPVQAAVTDQESRDRLLLGAAGMAVVAALGMAYQRRQNESAEVD